MMTILISKFKLSYLLENNMQCFSVFFKIYFLFFYLVYSLEYNKIIKITIVMISIITCSITA